MKAGFFFEKKANRKDRNNTTVKQIRGQSARTWESIKCCGSGNVFGVVIECNDTTIHYNIPSLNLTGLADISSSKRDRPKSHLHEKKDSSFRLKTTIWRFVWISERKRSKKCLRVVAVVFGCMICHHLRLPLLEWIQGSFAKNNPRPPIASAIGIIKIGRGSFTPTAKVDVTRTESEWHGHWMHFMTWRPSSQGRERFFFPSDMGFASRSRSKDSRFPSSAIFFNHFPDFFSTDTHVAQVPALFSPIYHPVWQPGATFRNGQLSGKWNVNYEKSDNVRGKRYQSICESKPTQKSLIWGNTSLGGRKIRNKKFGNILLFCQEVDIARRWRKDETNGFRTQKFR